MAEVLQIRVELLGIEPRIWRRILVGGECTFWGLHVAIQDAMGWTDSHLHVFRIHDPATGQMRYIGLPTEDDDLNFEPGWEHLVTEAMSAKQPQAVYEYDFGDSWEHAVVLEEVLPADGQGECPRCVAGERACPPEDVGGVPGYEDFVEAIGDPEHEEHGEYLAWAGGAFDPEQFDPRDVVFQDPDERWEDVFGEDAMSTGFGVVGPPQVEGAFTGTEIERLVLAPFGEDSPLLLESDLPDAALEEAPLVRDCRGFLQMLAEEAPLKLTQKGNLTKATISRLMEAGLLGARWQRADTEARVESDMPRATVLRMLPGYAGLTRKRHGKLDLTRRGKDAVAGKMPAGELYRRVMDTHVTRYNWSFADALPPSRWVQSLFWYALYLVQEHGDEKRPSSFYGDKLALAFPFALEDFASVRYATPRELLQRAFEWRVVMGFGVEFGLMCVAEKTPERWREPCEVWAGPLLSQVVTWRREGAAGGGASEDGDGTVIEGPW